MRKLFNKNNSNSLSSIKYEGKKLLLTAQIALASSMSAGKGTKW